MKNNKIKKLFRYLNVFKRIQHRFESKRDEYIGEYISAVKKLESLKELEENTLKRRLKLLAGFEVLEVFLVESLIIVIPFLSLAMIVIGIPISHAITGFATPFLTAFLLELPFLILFFSIVFFPLFLSMRKVKTYYEPNYNDSSTFIIVFFAWPIMIFLSLLPFNFPIIGSLSLNLMEVSNLNQLGYNFEDGYYIAYVSSFLIWISMILVVALMIAVGVVISFKKRRQCPESIILTEIAQTYSDLIDKSTLTISIAGQWPDADLRKSLASKLNTVVDTFTVWLPRAMYSKKGLTKTWYNLELLSIADRFRSIQKEILLPNSNSLSMVTTELSFGFKCLYQGRWAEFKSPSDPEPLPKPRLWSQIRPVIVFICLCAITIFLPEIQFINGVIPDAIMTKVQIFTGLIAFIYLFRLIDPTLETIVFELLRKKQ